MTDITLKYNRTAGTYEFNEQPVYLICKNAELEIRGRADYPLEIETRIGEDDYILIGAWGDNALDEINGRTREAYLKGERAYFFINELTLPIEHPLTACLYVEDIPIREVVDRDRGSST